MAALTATESRARLSRERARLHPVALAFEFFFMFLGVGAVMEYVKGLVMGQPAQPLVGGDLVVAALTAVLFTVAWRRWRRDDVEASSGS